jgi:hypothetical protein
MNQGGKGRRTRRRGEAKVEQQVRGNFLREWLQDRSAVVQKQNAAAAHARPPGSGVTLEMKAISREAAAREPEYVVLHTLPTVAMRANWSEKAQVLPKNQPYVNPARDLKPDRRLRAELRESVR